MVEEGCTNDQPYEFVVVGESSWSSMAKNSRNGISCRSAWQNRRRHYGRIPELLVQPYGMPPMDKNMTRLLYHGIKNVYSSLDRSHCTTGLLSNTHQLAKQLKDAGITPETIFLVWHTTFVDLTLLRELLESEGYDHILPPNENCIRMIMEYRPSLPIMPNSRKPFTASLEILFPILFPGHELIGTNHRALPDTQMLHLMILLLLELQKQPSQRQLSGFPNRTRQFIETGQAPLTKIQQWIDSWENPIFELIIEPVLAGSM